MTPTPPALESLVVSSGHEGNGLLSVDDAAVGSLVSYCPSLHTVGLVRVVDGFHTQCSITVSDGGDFRRW